MEGLIWFALLLMPLVILQRLLHREIQAILLIWTRNLALTVGLFSLIFLPGVFLHEFSHWLMARLLGVRTGRFSIIPHALPDGRLQLGFVETALTDPLRDSLIGLAPLITGGLVVAYTAITRLGLLPVWDIFRSGDLRSFWQVVQALPQVADFPLWFYLTFTVSSTMLPSASDRHSFLPLAMYMALLVGLFVVAGAWQFFQVLAPLFNDFLISVGTVFGLSAAVHILLVVPLVAIHSLLAGIMGVDVK